MQRTPLQKAAAGWAVFMVLLLSAIQLLSDGPGMPPVLWLIFSGVWVFGAAMLWWFPTFGAAGTALYGVILAVQVVRAHGTGSTNLLIVVGSLIGAGLAGAVLWARLKKR